MNHDLVFALLRCLTYLWVGATSYSLSQLYKDSYNFAGKNSPIIQSVIKILFCLSVAMLYLSFVALAYVISKTLHNLMISAIPVFMLPLGYLLTKFRKESVRKQ